MEEEPSLIREIGKVAWFFAKLIAATCIVVAPIVWLIVYHPVLGMIALYALIFAALIVFLGWQSYQSKKRALEWKSEVDAARRKRAS
jgi:hypothetical protein